jgi:hypothetical protein
MKINKNIPYDHYHCVVGIGFYFSGQRINSKGEVTIVKPTKLFNNLISSLLRLRDNEQERKERWLYVIIDDDSPYKSDELYKIVTTELESYVYIQLQSNVGVGGKENIIQSIALQYADFVFRLDADVKLITSINGLFDAFSEITNLGVATIRAGFIGNLYFYQNPTDKYIFTAQIGNGVLWSVKALKRIGIANNALRYFEDLDLVYKAKYEGLSSVMVMNVVGNTISSGTGGTASFERQQESAKLLVNSNPLVSYSISKIGKPIIRYNKNYGKVALFDSFIINKESPSEIAQSILKQL